MYGDLRRKIKQKALQTISYLPRHIQNQIVDTIREKRDGDLRWFEYPLSLKCRWPENQPNEHLLQKILEQQKRYDANLAGFVKHLPALERVAVRAESEVSPSWINGWVSALDAIAIYGFLANRNPATYWEVGSGSSTKFARHAIKSEGLRTKIISIDPHPRKEIDLICDQTIRERFESVPAELFSKVKSGDVIFVDNSHVALMNSDVTVFFLEVLPKLPAGVLIGVHDIFWPYDYPDNWAERLYAEQYLLGAMLIGGERLTIELPAYFLWVEQHKHVSNILSPLYSKFPHEVEKHGGAFWFTWEG